MRDIEIRLLGRPEIRRGGEAVTPPRGRKAWAVLAFVALAERPVARERLSAMLFADARDPLGALRWTLAQLRRALSAPDLLTGNPLEPDSLAELSIDVLAIAGAEPAPGMVRGELLEGLDPGGDGVFASWLAIERRRLSGVCEGVLRDAALTALADGRPRDGAALASRALELGPFDETLNELLVRCLARGGDIGAARHHATTCDLLFQRELGRRPDPRIRRAADDGPSAADAIGDHSAALAQLRAGEKALDAGAVEPGIACLRSACAEARALADPQLLSQALLALGLALVHAVRGRDEEAAALLHEALALATTCHARETAVGAARELGYVDVQAGRAGAAGRWLHRATDLVETDEERAAVLGVRGMALSDRAHYGAAKRLLGESVSAAERAGDERQAAWSLAILGRALLLCGELDEARDALDRSLLLVDEQSWIALQPLPEALRGEVRLRQGDPDAAVELFEHAFSLGCHMGDPCWEALGARGRGLAHAEAGEQQLAVDWLKDAVVRSVRVADSYVWIHAYCLDALAGVLAGVSPEETRSVVDQLEHIAARGDMRELVVRAALHRGRLGDPSGAATAEMLAEDIDNPLLRRESAVGSSLPA